MLGEVGRSTGGLSLVLMRLTVFKKVASACCCFLRCLHLSIHMSL